MNLKSDTNRESTDVSANVYDPSATNDISINNIFGYLCIR